MADVMTKEVVYAEPDTTFRECADLLRIHKVSALPVVDFTGRVIGIVSEADLLAKEEARGSSARLIDKLSRRRRRAADGRLAEDVMSSPPITVRPFTTVAQAARLMHGKHVKRLPVIDDNGWLVGIVSRADLLKTFLRSDGSIRREIVDDVLHRKFFVDPATATVEVRKGLVRLRGQVETKSLSALIEREVEAIEGTIGVDNSLTFKLDDTGLRVEEPPRSLQLSAIERERPLMFN